MDLYPEHEFATQKFNSSGSTNLMALFRRSCSWTISRDRERWIKNVILTMSFQQYSKTNFDSKNKHSRNQLMKYILFEIKKNWESSLVRQTLLRPKGSGYWTMFCTYLIQYNLRNIILFCQSAPKGNFWFNSKIDLGGRLVKRNRFSQITQKLFTSWE